MTDLPDTETSAVGRNTEFNEVVKCVVIVIKIKFNGCRVTERCGVCRGRVTERCAGCRVTERCAGCRVTERCAGCRGRVTERCVGCRGRVTERCVGCLHCVVIGISISI